MRVEVFLEGGLKTLSEGPVVIEAVTAADVVLALCANYPEFPALAAGDDYILSYNAAGTAQLTKDQVDLPLAESSLYVVPVVAGQELSFMAQLVYTIIITIITNKVLQLLFPPEDPEAEGKDSHYFSGKTSTSKQGLPVPLVYGGPILVAGHVISSDMAIVDESRRYAFANGPQTGWEEVTEDRGDTGPVTIRRPTYEAVPVYDLVSKAEIELVEVLSEGEIEGFATADPDESIYLNGSQAKVAGSDVYKGLQHVLRKGEPFTAGGFMSAIKASQPERSTSVGITVSSASPVSVAIVTPEVDSISLVVAFPRGLLKMTGSGKEQYTPVELQFEISASGGAFQPALVTAAAGESSTSSLVIRGRTNSYYEKSLTLPAIDSYGAAPYTVRITKVTPDSTSLNKVNDVQWKSYSERFDHRMAYHNTSVIKMTVEAEQFDNSVPERQYLLKGIKIRVPNGYTSYDPATNTPAVYPGTWDGTFVTAWSSNPAWIAFDLITNKRYGLGRRISSTVESTLKWSLYNVAKYCDEMVDDGAGLTEPRFTYSGTIRTASEANKVLKDMFSVFRGVHAWHSSGLMAITDAPSDPVYLYTPSNVLGGDFTYSTSSSEDRFNTVLVSWSAPFNLYDKVVEYVESPDAVRTDGLKQTSAVALGATTRGQAVRTGKALVLASQLEGETVTFTTGLEGIRALPGAVIKVQDPARSNGKQLGGRILDDAATVSAFIPDRDVVLDAGVAYTITVIRDTGELDVSAVSNAAGTYGPTSGLPLTLTTPLPSVPRRTSVWALSSDASETTTELWRIVGIEEGDGESEGEYAITGAYYDAAKYALIDSGIRSVPVEAPPTTNTSVIPPATLLLSEGERRSAGGVVERYFLSQFQISNDPYIKRHVLTWRRNDDDPVTVHLAHDRGFYELVNPEFGTYTVTVHAESLLGLRSAVITGSYVITDVPRLQDSLVTGLELVGKGTVTTFEGKDAHFQWRLNALAESTDLGEDEMADTGGMPDWFLDYEVRMLDSAGAILRTDYVRDPAYSYTYEKNLADTGPRRVFTIEVRVRSSADGSYVDVPATLSVSNPAPPVPSGISLVPSYNVLQVKMTQPTDNDYVGTVMWMSTTPSFTPDDTNLVHRGRALAFALASLTAGINHYVRIASEDAFGYGPTTTELVVATLTIARSDLDVTPPTAPTNLVLASSVLVSKLYAMAYASLTWTAGTDVGGFLSGYNIEYWTDAETTATTEFYPAQPSPSTTIQPLKAGTKYYFRVQSVDWAGNLSAWTATGSITTAGDSSPAANVNTVALASGLHKTIATWLNPTDDHYLETIVYRGTTFGFVANAASEIYSGRGNTVVEEGDPDVNYYFKFATVTSSGVVSAVSAASGPIIPDRITSVDAAKYFASAAIGNAYIADLDAVKITTGFLAAARIAATSITVDKLNVSQLSGISADLGTVTAGILQGPIIRTAASGARSQIDSVGVRGFNATTTVYHLSNDGSGFLGLSNAISWDAAGVVSVPGSIIAGEIIGNIIRTAQSGWRAEMGPESDGGTVYLFRYHDGAGDNRFSVDDAGNLQAKGLTITDLNGNTILQAGDPTVRVNPALGTGVVPNGSFTAGIDSWENCEGTGTATIVQVATHGNVMQLLNSGGARGMGSGTFDLIPGQRYQSRLTVRRINGTGTIAGAYFRMSYTADDEGRITAANRDGIQDFFNGGAAVISEDWQTLTYEWFCPAGMNFGALQFYNWLETTADFQVARMDLVPVDHVADNLTRKGSFEDGFVGPWDFGPNVSTSASSSTKFNYWLAWNNRDAFDRAPSEMFPVVQDEVIYIECYMSASGNSHNIAIGLHFIKEDGTQSWHYLDALTAGTGETFMQGHITAPAKAVKCRPLLYQYGSSPWQNAYVSQIRILRDGTKRGLEALTTIDQGGLHVQGTNAKITVGNTTGYLAGDGMFAGRSGGVSKFHIGDPANETYLAFDGTDVELGRNTTILGGEHWAQDRIYLSYNWMYQHTGSKSVGPDMQVLDNLGGLQLRTNGAGSSFQASELILSHDMYHSSMDWASTRRFKFSGTYAITSSLVEGRVGTGQQSYAAGQGLFFEFHNNGVWGVSYASGALNFDLPTTTVQLTSSGNQATAVDFEIEFVPGVHAKFYIDGVLEGTITSGLPDNVAKSQVAFYAQMQTTTGGPSGNHITIGPWKLLQE